MNRTIRSIILAGVIMLSILLFNTQPAQAGKSPTVFRVGYEGSISLLAEFNLPTTAADVLGFWSTKGKVFIPDVDFDLASIDFGSWTISLSEYQKNQVAWGFVGANAKSDPAFSSSFDPKEPSITIPFQIKNIKYGNPKCGGIRNFPCNLWVGMQGMIGKFSAMLTTIKLEAYFKDGNKMGGSCSLPGWDDRGSAYSETCKWIAFSVNIHTNNNWTNIGSGKK
jgi:hypothetical protein